MLIEIKFWNRQIEHTSINKQLFDYACARVFDLSQVTCLGF
jgi:hypothetical protein